MTPTDIKLMDLALSQPVASYLRTMTMAAVKCGGGTFGGGKCEWREEWHPGIAHTLAPHCINHGGWYTPKEADKSQMGQGFG